MKRIARLLPLLALGLFAIAGCEKEGGDDDPSGGKTSVKISAPKVTDPATGNAQTIAWQAGDKIAMLSYKAPTAAGLLSSNNVVNFSSNRFSAEAAGSTATFSGRIPELGDKLPKGSHPLFAVFPACNLSVSAQSYQNDGSCYYKITGPTIAARQDGTGWRYCCFTSKNGTVSVKDRSIDTAPVFSLANTLVRFNVISSKDVKRIEIRQEEQELPGLAGPFTLYTTRTAIAECSSSYNITLESGGKALAAEVLFACHALLKGRTLTFTFTMTDGSTVSRAVKVESTCEPGKMYSLSPFELTEGISTELASQAVRNMGMGINVGGFETVTATTEAIADRADESGMHILDRNDPVTYITNAANDPITQKTMDALRAAGFSSVRLPVTWFNHMDPPYTTSAIDQVWLDYLKYVVDLARNAGMYVVINIHHDAGTKSFCWLLADWTNYSTISTTLKNIWTQVANHFKDYDYHLLFEGFNEICDEYTYWYAPKTNNGFRAANALNQDFVNAVRATGGNNAVRNLIVSTYTSSERDEALDGFVMPQDAVTGHLIVQVHSYRPNEFVTARDVGDRSRLEFYESDKAEIDEMFDRVQAKVLSKGWPCFLGEYGAFSKKDANGNRNEPGRGAHGYYYTLKALRRGIVPMYWYNPMCYRDRDEGRWTYPVLADSLKKAWSDFQTGKHPEIQ